jgi:hypothetical protein
MNELKGKQLRLLGNEQETAPVPPKKPRKSKIVTSEGPLPANLGKAIRLPVPDFNDPQRKLTVSDHRVAIFKKSAIYG